MTFTLKMGDMFEDIDPGRTTVLGHGVNCMGIMGAGVAAIVRNKFASAHELYVEACASGELEPGLTQLLNVNESLYLANIASQNYPGKDAKSEWVISAVEDLIVTLRENNLLTAKTQIRVPLIAGGIGGLTPAEAFMTILGAFNKLEPTDVEVILFLHHSQSGLDTIWETILNEGEENNWVSPWSNMKEIAHDFQ